MNKFTMADIIFIGPNDRGYENRVIRQIKYPPLEMKETKKIDVVLEDGTVYSFYTNKEGNMNKQTLEKVNELIEQLEIVNAVLEPEGEHKVTVVRESENVYGTSCFKGYIVLDWELVEPLVKDRQKKLVSELKALGYEDYEDNEK
jgi:hypothetical protein